MREIKFRAWLNGPGRMIGWEELANDYGIRQMCAFETLMQYTGLKDKNGKEIYEGDIVYRKNPMAWLVPALQSSGITNDVVGTNLEALTGGV